MATAMPTRPPIRTSLPSRLFVPKSTPAAPAVAKKPTTYVRTNARTPRADSAGAASGVTARCASTSFVASKLPRAPAVLRKRVSRMPSGIRGSYVATRATYWMPLSPTNAARTPHTAIKSCGGRGITAARAIEEK